MEKKNKKILIATGIYPPDIGGPATYSKLLKEELPRRGFDVRVLSFGEVRHLPKIARHFAYFFKVLKVGKGVDLIYAQDPVSVGLPAALAAKLLRKRFVLKVVGDYAWEQGVQRFGVKDSLDDFSTHYLRYPLSVRILKKIEYRVARSAAKVITPSNYLKKIISNWGISKENISVVYNAFSHQKDPGNKEELRKSLRLEGKVVTSAGRLVPWKGFDTLIGIMPGILEKFPDAKLLIAGEGPEKKTIEKLIGELNLEGKVILLGGLPQDVLLKYIKASDVFALNTSYEGLSHQLLEVMSLGAPIVTTNVGGNPEVIENGKEGVLVSYNDARALENAIISLLSGDTWELATRAQEKLKIFDKEKMIQETIEVLKNV